MNSESQSNQRIPEVMSYHKSVQPTLSSDKAMLGASTERDIYNRPTQASSRRLGMLAAVDPPSCLHNPISYNVTLRHGLRSGHFKNQGRVDSFDVCFRHCCHDDECNLVFMLQSYCYLVSCYDQESCALNPLVTKNNRELAVAFVYKEHTNGLMDWNRASMPDMSSLPANYQTTKQIGSINQNSDQTFNPTLQNNPQIESDYYKKNQMNLDMPNSYFTEKDDLRNQLHSNQFEGTTGEIHDPLLNFDTTPNIKGTVQNNSPTCIPGPERYFTTLQFGLTPGYFSDIGYVQGMETCKQRCCENSDCDVALMEQERCYLVTCPRVELCQDVVASPTRGITRISHMFREGRSTANEAGVSSKVSSIDSNGNTYPIGDNRQKIYDENRNSDMRDKGFHDLKIPNGMPANQGINHKEDVGRTPESRDNSYIARSTSGNEEFRGNEVSRVDSTRHTFMGIGHDQVNGRDSQAKMERKDKIPGRYGGNKIADITDNDEDMKLLRDVIEDIGQKKHLQLDEDSHELRNPSEIPAPPVQVKTDFEKLYDESRQGPLVFDDSAGKRRQESHSEGLGDMASDILSNILKHRSHDTIESIWSHDKDPLQNEITKVKDTNTPEKIEKLLREPLSKEHGKRVSNNDYAGDISVLSGGTGSHDQSSKTSGDINDEAKLIETLYNLVKQNLKANNNGNLKQNGHFNEQRPVFDQEMNGKKIANDGNAEGETNSNHEEYPDYVDTGYDIQAKNTDGELSNKFKHRQTKGRLKVNKNDFNYRDYNGDDDFDEEINHTGDEKYGDDIIDEGKHQMESGKEEERIGANAHGGVMGNENGIQGNKIHEKFRDRMRDRQSAEEQGKMNANIDQDLDYISGKLDESDNLVDDNNYSDYNDNDSDYSDELSNMDYYDTLGVKRKMSRPTGRKHAEPKDLPHLFKHKGRFSATHLGDGKPSALSEKPLVIVQQKQPLGNENIMSELEKIEDELADVKSKQTSEECAVEKMVKKPVSKNISDVQNGNDAKLKESIVDILANMKDVGTPQLEEHGKMQILNKTNEPKEAESDDKNVILDELNEVKEEIANITKSSIHSGEMKVSPKVDNFGDRISDLLDDNWDFDKRSQIPIPLGSSYQDARVHGDTKVGLGDYAGGKRLVFFSRY